MLKKLNIRHKSIKYVLLGILISIFVCVLSQRFTIILSMDQVSSEKGSIQIYYQDKPNAPLTEENSLISAAKTGDIEFDIKKNVFMGNQIRIDLNDVREICFSKISIKWNGISVYEADKSVLLESKINENDILDDELRVSSVGEDPYIVFELKTLKCFWLFGILFAIKTILIFVILFAITKLIKYYEKRGVRFEKYIKIGIVAFLLISIGYYAIYAINTIRDWGIQSYYIHDKNAEYCELTNDEIRTEFINYGEKTVYLAIDVEDYKKTEGDILYRIEDCNGNTVLGEQRTSIEDSSNIEENQLVLDVSSAELSQNQQYTLCVQLVGTKNMHIRACMSNDQFVLRQYFEFTHYILYLSVIGICVLAAIIMGGCFLKWGMSNRLYVVVSLVIGILIIFISPPASRDDEYRHFIRAYTLANGDYSIPMTELTGEEIGNTASGHPGKGQFVDVPKEMSDIRLLDYSVNYNDGSYFAEINQKLCVDRLFSLLRDDIEKETVKVSVIGTAPRGWIYYWPQAIAIYIGILLGARPIFLFYISRLGQLIICTLLGYISLKITDKCRDLIWLLSFIPNTFLLKASCNTDGLLIAEIILYVSMLFCIEERKIDLSSKKGIIPCVAVFILGIIITKSKLPFLIVCVASLLVLNKNNVKNAFGFVKKNWKIVLPLLMVMFGVSAVFCYVNIKVIMNSIYSFLPYEHIQYIFGNPIYIIKLFTNKLIQQLGELVASLNGSYFVPYSMVLLISLLLSQKMDSINVFKKCAFFGSFILSMLAIILVGFTLTPPDMGYIWGITFRYVLPALPLAAIALPIGTIETQKNVRNIYPILIIVTLSISCIVWVTEWWGM